MTGVRPSESHEPIGPDDFAEGLAGRNEAFRVRILQTMILGALVLRPLPDEVATRVEAFARTMSVDDAMLGVARRFAQGQLGLAAIGFDRNGYTADWSPERAETLRTTTRLDDAWQQAADDPELAGRSADLAHLAADSLGRKVWEFNQARGFGLPRPTRLRPSPPRPARLGPRPRRLRQPRGIGARSLRLHRPRQRRPTGLLAARHDHQASSRPATSPPAPACSKRSPDNSPATAWPNASPMPFAARALSHGPGGEPDIDFLALDWFALAEQPIHELQDRFGIVPKSTLAIRAGSVGPWQPGGISPFQHDTGRQAAAAQGRTYNTYGATP